MSQVSYNKPIKTVALGANLTSKGIKIMTTNFASAQEMDDQMNKMQDWIIDNPQADLTIRTDPNQPKPNQFIDRSEAAPSFKIDQNLNKVTIAIDNKLAKANGMNIDSDLIERIEGHLAAINISSPFVKAVLHNQAGVLSITTQVKITDTFVDDANPYFQVMTEYAEAISDKVVNANAGTLDASRTDKTDELINEVLDAIHKELIAMYPLLTHMDTSYDKRCAIRAVSTLYTNESLSKKLAGEISGHYWLTCIENAAVTLFTSIEQDLLEMAETLNLGIVQSKKNSQKPLIVALANFHD